MHQKQKHFFSIFIILSVRDDTFDKLFFLLQYTSIHDKQEGFIFKIWHSIRTELTNNGLLVLLPNCYTTRGVLSVKVYLRGNGLSSPSSNRRRSCLYFTLC